MKAAGQPLAGVRVLELAQNLAGPWCAQILGDLGASVIKVERPDGGDAARHWGPPFVNGAGSIFAATNRGKRSMSLDLGAPESPAVLERLIRDSDILIEAFRPGTFEAMGYGWEVVQRWNPRLLYCSVTAYGETGPLRHLPGYDPLMQAHGGLMSVTGHATTGPARAGTSVIDMGAGMWLCIAVLAALRDRDRTGEGRRLSVALFETALTWNAYHLIGHAADGTVPGPMGTELPMIAPYGAFPTVDGQIMIAAGNDNLFRRLCAALGLDAATDPRLDTNPGRVANRAEINDLVAGATARHGSAELLAILRSAGVPCAPILDIAGVADDPQTLASGMLTVGEAGPVLGLPMRLDGERIPAGGVVPAPGEHTAEILRELGVSEPAA
jgi:crotonobetainyl-CoA:carnitine CoA-transferase CaiB-like acyl-CoA transferase